MAKVIKKFLQADAIDGSKIKLGNQDALKAVKADGTVQSLLELDGNDKLVLFKLPVLPDVAPADALDVASKGYVDGQVSGEAARAQGEEVRIEGLVSQEAKTREAADQGLDGRLQILEADPVTKSYVDAADTALQGNIDVEKARIDAILEASDADKDSFAEIVQLINSVDTENDNAFAAYVLSNDSAVQAVVDNLSNEVTARQNADNSLATQIGLETKNRIAQDTSLSSSIASLQATKQNNLTATLPLKIVGNTISANQATSVELGSAADAAGIVSPADYTEIVTRKLFLLYNTGSYTFPDLGTGSSTKFVYDYRGNANATWTLGRTFPTTAGRGFWIKNKSNYNLTISSPVCPIEVDGGTATSIVLYPGEGTFFASATATYRMLTKPYTADIQAVSAALSSGLALEAKNRAADIASVNAAISGEISRASGEESRIEGLVTAEAARAAGEEARIEGLVNDEVSRAAGEEARIEGKVDQEIVDRQGAISEEQAARQKADDALASDLAAEAKSREAADIGLQSAIDTEKGRIDAILLASDADKDSFAEIVQLINSVDTANDNAFASYVLSNDAALAQEVKERQAAVSAEESARISAVNGLAVDLAGEAAIRAKADNAITSRLDSLELDPVSKAYVDTAVAGEAAARQKSDTAIEGRTSVLEANYQTEYSDRVAADNAEQLARMAADSALDARLSPLEISVPAEEKRALAAESALSGRVGALEAVVWSNFRLTFTGVPVPSLTLPYAPIAGSTMVHTGTIFLTEGEDYTVSDNVITFIGDFDPAAELAFEIGDKINVKYQHA